MLNPKVSVIIPVYNVENYLKRCLDSIDAQTYDNYEVILVDDGSTDGSGTMCDLYEKDQQNAIVIHQQNQGLSAARNAGIDIAKGEYLVFVDSDDFVSENCLSYLMHLCVQTNCNLSAGRMNAFVYDDKIEHKSGESVEILEPVEALKKSLYGSKGFGVSACAKCFHRSLFASIRFPVGRKYEDMATIPLVIGKSNRIAIGDETIYYYRQLRRDSITNEVIEQAFYDRMKSTVEIINYSKKEYPEATDAAKSRYARLLVDSLFGIKGLDQKSKSLFRLLNEKMSEEEYINTRDNRLSAYLKAGIFSMKRGLLFSILFAKFHRIIKKIIWKTQ